MNILSICSNPDVLEVMVLVKLLIRAITIIVPIILIVVLSIDYMKAVSASDDTMVYKVTKNLPYRAVAALFIFFIPSLVKIVVFIADSDANDIYSCIENANPELIQVTYQNNARTRLDRLKETLSLDDYNNAKITISEIDDNTIRTEYENELNELKKYVDIKSKINKLMSNYNKTEYNNIVQEINNVGDSSIKEKLLLALEEIKGQQPMDVQSGAFQKKFTGSKDYLDYWEFIPNNATTNMPLVVFLHGDGEVSNINSIKNLGFIRGTKNLYGDDFPYIVLQPNRRSQRWQVDSVMTTLKELIDETCDKYLCDTDHIIITGMSGGAVGVWSMVSKYGDYFSCAVPVSCPGYVKTESYKNVPVRAFVGGASDDYNTYYGSMAANVHQLKNAGLSAALEVIPGGTHGSTYHTVYSTQEVVDWMLEQ
jgi:predicted peptidase